MKPCNCIDEFSALTKLKEQGICHNNYSLMLNDGKVEINTGNCIMKIPIRIFKIFSEWYLTDQK